jgi:hypothetical protein
MSTKEVIKYMVNDILADRNNDALEKFNQAISLKVADAIEKEKITLSKNLYAGNQNDSIQ